MFLDSLALILNSVELKNPVGFNIEVYYDEKFDGQKQIALFSQDFDQIYWFMRKLMDTINESFPKILARYTA